MARLRPSRPTQNWLSRRNLPVLHPAFDFSAEIHADALAQAIRKHRAAFDMEGAEHEAAYAFSWRGPPSYDRLSDFARGIVGGLADRIGAGLQLYILIEGDAAFMPGSILREELGVRAKSS